MKYFSRIALVLSIALSSYNVVGQHGWTVNPADYSYNGQINALIYLGPVEVTTGTLGAFVDGTCRGYIDGTLFPPTGKVTFNLICYSNLAAGEILTFRYYDPSDGSKYNINETIEFVADMIVADDLTPFEFNIDLLNATPTATPGTICIGESVQLDAGASGGSGSYTYSWTSDPEGFTSTLASPTAIPSVNTTYYVAVNDGYSTVNAQVSVTVNALPVVDAGSDISIPNGTSTTLDATVTGTGPFTFSWDPPSLLVNASVEDPTTVNLSTTTLFTLTATSTTTGCSNSDAVTVTITGGSLSAAPTATPGTVCAGAIVQLYAGASGGSGTYTYTWTSTPTGFTSSLANPTANPTVSTTYNVAVNDGYSTVNAQVSVTVNALPATPTITASGPTTFCVGGSVTLTSSSGTSYLWSTGETTQSINVTTSDSYTVRVTDANGCQSLPSAATVVTVNALPETPTITASGPTTFCSGGSVTLTSSSGTIYLWSTGETTQSINVTTSGSYTVRVTDSNGCQSLPSSATVVTVNALPVVDAGSNISIPNGTSTTLNGTVTGTGPFTYEWEPPSLLVDASVEDPTTLNLSATTVFTLTATSTITGCSNADAVTVTITGGALSATPTATPGTICVGASVQLDAGASGGSGSYTYSWTSVPAGFTSSLANPTANPTVNTTYQVAVNDGYSTVNSQVSVTVNALPATPTITASGPTTFCAGGSVTLTSSSGTSYLWSTGATTQSINVTTSGSYTVQVTNASGCQSLPSAATVVTVNALPATPTITASGPTTFCAGGSVTLTSSAGTSYLWSTGATTQSINVTTSGSYTVRVTDSNGCQSLPSSATVVTVNALPVVNAGTDVSIPNGTNTTLDGTVTGTGPFTYEWEPSSLLVNPSEEDPTTVNLSATTVFTLTATSSTTGCSNSDAVTVTITGGGLSSTPTATPGTICVGATVQLDAGASGGSGTYTYSWTSVPSGFTSNLAKPTANPVVTTTYYVAVNDGYSTVNSQVSVTVNALPATPTITASGPTTFCVGGSVTLTSSASTSYLWSTGATTRSINVTTSGSYTVRVTDANGCQSLPSAATVVTVNALPAAPTITASGPTTFCAGGSVTLTSSNGTIYLWSTGATTQSINVTTSGSYTVRVTDINGCQSLPSAATVVTVNALPAAPTITASGPTTFCDGGSVTLTSSTGTSYLWSTGATTRSINVTTSGSYTVRVTNTNGCQSLPSAATVVTVNALPAAPTITASGPTTFCAGGSVTLTSSTSTSYLWSTGATTRSINVTTSGSYTVRVTDSNGCQSLPSAATVVTVNALPAAPTITASGPTTFCDGESVTLTSSTGTGYLWSTGATTQSINVTEGGSYSVRITDSNGCQSAPSASTTVTIRPLPSAPSIGTITPPTCTSSTGSVILNGLPSSGTWIINGTPGGITKTGTGTSTTISNLVANTYTFTVTNADGCTSLPSASVVIPAQPPTPAPPIVGTITPPTCTVTTGSVVLSGLPSTGTWTLTRYPGGATTTGTGTSTTISGLASGTYNYTVTNSYGCVSLPSSNVVIPAQPPTPSAPLIGTITQPTCDVATGSVVLTGLPSGAWTITRSPGDIITTGSGNSTIISGLGTGTYTFTVTNSDGCISLPSASVVMNAQPVTPGAPVVGTITQPTCVLATGSVVLTGLPSTGTWILTRSPGGATTEGSGTSTTVTGLATGTYTFTVTSAAGCTSPSSANVVINSQPPTPASPSQTIDCSLGAGNAIVTVTSPTGAGYQYRLDAGTYQTATSFAGVDNGSHTVTVRNSYGCTTTGPVFSVSCDCANPPTVTLSSNGGSTCGTTSVTVSGNVFGGSATSVTLTENGAGTLIPASTSTTPFAFLYTPVAADVGKTVIITVTTNNPLGTPCTEASATYTLTVNTIPVAPTVGTRTHPTCTVPTGSVVLTGLPSTGTWILTRSPGGATTEGSGTSTTVTGLTTGTYTFTVTSAAGCTSPSSANVVINAQPPTPEAPVIGTITHPTCAVSTGSVVLSGLPSTGTWTVIRTPGGVTRTGSGTTVTITTIPAGTYTFTVTNSYGCISPPSAEAVINAQPPTPAAPSVGTITPPTCSVSTGSVVLLGLPSTGSWTLTQYPGTVTTTGTGTSKTVSGLATGTYNFTVTNEYGCISLASANIVIPAQPPTPAAPGIGTITQPTYAVPTGSVVLTGLPSGAWTITRSPGDVTTTGSGINRIITGLPAGVFTFTVTNSYECTSESSAEVIISTPGPPTLVINDPAPVCSPSTVDLTAAEITEGSTPGLTYTYWTDADATIPYENPESATTGTYYIKATTVSGFFDIKPVIVRIDQMPFANAGDDQVLDYLFETSLDAELGENETGIWSLVSGSGDFYDETDPKTTINDLSLGENIILWTVSNGVCPASLDYITITVRNLVIPTLITPNMDGKNDYFILRGIESLGKTEIVIFDRRGAQVYKNENYNNDWDGIDYNGNPLPEDTYFYVLKSQNGKSLSGYIVIRR